MLVLLDIDGTLIRSHGAGSRSMRDAARELFGDTFTFDGVEIAGQIDPVIWATVARINGLENHEAQHALFRETYRRHLVRRLAREKLELLPGVRELIGALDGVEGLTRGLLTGNYPETGRLKIESAGLELDGFRVTAWGSDGRSRRDLPRHAMRRHLELTGRAVEPGDVLVVGDTPHDVDCARACGCRVLAVATGIHPRETLAACEPDLVVDDLAETTALLDWMLAP